MTWVKQYSAGLLAHSSWQTWCNWVRFVSCITHPHLFWSAHKFSMGLRSGLCDGYSKTLTLLSSSRFLIILAVCLGSLSIWKTHLPLQFCQTTGHVSRNCLFLCVFLQTVIWPMLVQVRFHCGQRHFRTSFSQHLHKVFCFCSETDSHILDQNTFIPGTQSLFPSWAVWWRSYLLNRWLWHLQASGNCTQG